MPETHGECPVCGEQYHAAFFTGESAMTPWRIDEQWKICVGDGVVFAHSGGPVAKNISRETALVDE